jgi:hypothetical protein
MPEAVYVDAENHICQIETGICSIEPGSRKPGPCEKPQSRHVEYIAADEKNEAKTGICNSFTPYYVSGVTFSTLGFTDLIRPKSLTGQLVLLLNVFFGYTVLGLLLAILANTVARRS